MFSPLINFQLRNKAPPAQQNTMPSSRRSRSNHASPSPAPSRHTSRDREKSDRERERDFNSHHSSRGTSNHLVGSGDESSDGEDSDPSPDNQGTKLSSGRGASTELLPSVSRAVDEVLVQKIKEIASSNPLSEKIPVTVLNETVQEIANEIKEQILLSVTVSNNRYHWKERIKDYLENEEEEKERYGEEIPGEIREEIESCIKKSLLIPSGSRIFQLCH